MIVGQVLKTPALEVGAASVVTGFAEISLSGHTCLLCYVLELELAFLHGTALHRNVTVLKASSGISNTPLCRQVVYLTPIWFFGCIAQDAELSQQMNPCATCYSPGRPSGCCLFLATRLALGYYFAPVCNVSDLSASVWFLVFLIWETGWRTNAACTERIFLS